MARFRLYRHRFLQVDTSFAAFFEIYKIMQLTLLTKFGRLWQSDENNAEALPSVRPTDRSKFPGYARRKLFCFFATA